MSVLPVKVECRYERMEMPSHEPLPVYEHRKAIECGVDKNGWVPGKDRQMLQATKSHVKSLRKHLP
jgi:hypothetical protein